MDIERALISKIIATGQLETCVSQGITRDSFADEECAAMFAYVQIHTRVYRSTPSMEAAKEAHPEFEFEHIQDPLEYVVDRFHKLVRKRLADDLIFELAEAIDDPERVGKIELEFMEAAREIAMVVPSTEVKRFSDMDKRIEEYEQEKEEGLRTGIPFGFPTLDHWTGGIQPHEFVTAAAFSGVGKSTMLRAIAFNIYSMPEDIVVLYLTLEEQGKAILRKFDAMAADLTYQKLKQLGLEPEDVDRWREKAAAVRKKMDGKDIIVLDKIRGCTPDKVSAETIKHKPDIVFVDYLSLMRSSSPNRQTSMWQTLTEITQDMKQNARVLEIPIIAAAQTNRSSRKDGADLDNIGYSLSVVQDSDIVLGLHANDEMKDDKLMEVVVRKNREGRLGKFSCVWDHEGSIFREETMRDRFGRPGSEQPKPKAGDKSAFVKGPRPTRDHKPKARPRPTRR